MGWILTFVLVLAFTVGVFDAQAASSDTKPAPKSQASGSDTKPALKPQATCPIMGSKINKDLYADVAGYRVYVCCPGCIAKVKQDPDKALAALYSKGEAPEVRLVVCAKCGELKGDPKACGTGVAKCAKAKDKTSCGNAGKAKCAAPKAAAKCCNPDAVKCAKCGLNKGSIGCCKDLKPAPGEKEVVLCSKCGEIKGTAQCYKTDTIKCAKCGLNKGSPGCCKLPARGACSLSGSCKA